MFELWSAVSTGKSAIIMCQTFLILCIKLHHLTVLLCHVWTACLFNSYRHLATQKPQSTHKLAWLSDKVKVTIHDTWKAKKKMYIKKKSYFTITSWRIWKSAYMHHSMEFQQSLKEVQHTLVFFAIAGLTKPETPVQNNRYHNGCC